MSSLGEYQSADANFEADIARIETGIKQLKVHYDRFFAGALSHEPRELRGQIERLIRRHAYSTSMKYAQRFHFNAVVSRFNSLSELWAKTTRKMEEGDLRQRSQMDQFEIRERLVARARLKNGKGNGDEVSLRRLYKRFVEARRVNGEKNRRLSYEGFVRGISAQTDNLRKTSGCAEIELRVVLRDQKVQVKARPGN
jgi:hypothetical protein